LSEDDVTGTVASPNGLRIVWASVRNFDTDLCATTQQALLDGMAEVGHEVLMLSPGGPPADGHAWSHLGVQDGGGFGRRSRAIAQRIAVRWPEVGQPDLVLVDWPLVPVLRKAGVLNDVPWLLMDRSPPAQAGLRGRLHWSTWKRAWAMATAAGKDRPGPVGAAVSHAHRDLINARTKAMQDRVVVLPAGVDLDRFMPGAERRSTKEEVRLVYHGRLDKNRGVLALPMLLGRLSEAGVDASMTMIGTGDAVGALERMAKGLHGLEVLAPLPRDELARKLGRAHVGFLPMPEEEAWVIASPLKRGEYLAAGMNVIGVDHAGHRLHGLEAGMMLYPQASLLDGAVDHIRKIAKDPEVFLTGKKAARAYAEANLSWDVSVDRLLGAIDETLGVHNAAESTVKVLPGLDGEPPVEPEPEALPEPEPGPEPLPEPEVKETPPLEAEPAPEPEEDPEPEPAPEPQPEPEAQAEPEKDAPTYTTLHERMSAPPPEPEAPAPAREREGPADRSPPDQDDWKRPPPRKF
jgi:glycosyltransferase involved in cell wall biosynthesis